MQVIILGQASMTTPVIMEIMPPISLPKKEKLNNLLQLFPYLTAHYYTWLDSA